MSDWDVARRILHYEAVDRLPIVHFGFWWETLQKWAGEGHITQQEADTWGDGNPSDAAVGAKLGFDYNWGSTFYPACDLQPYFDGKVVRGLPDGSRHVLNGEGVVVLEAPGAVSIQAEIEHLLRDRASWEEHYKWRYQWSEDRITHGWVRANDVMLRWDRGGLEFLRSGHRPYIYGLYCGSLLGKIRNVLGVEGMAYLMMDDEGLFDEMLQTVGELCYRNVKYALESGARFDFGHFWEDICFQEWAVDHAGCVCGEGGAALSAHYGSVAQTRNRHCLTRLRRLHRCAHSHVGGQWREHDVSDGSGDVEREHRAVAGEVREGDSRRGGDEQGRVCPRSSGDRCGSGAVAAAGGAGRVYSVSGSPDCAGCEVGVGAVLL